MDVQVLRSLHERLQSMEQFAHNSLLERIKNVMHVIEIWQSLPPHIMQLRSVVFPLRQAGPLSMSMNFAKPHDMPESLKFFEIRRLMLEVDSILKLDAGKLLTNDQRQLALSLNTWLVSQCARSTYPRVAERPQSAAAILLQRATPGQAIPENAGVPNESPHLSPHLLSLLKREESSPELFPLSQSRPQQLPQLLLPPPAHPIYYNPAHRASQAPTLLVNETPTPPSPHTPSPLASTVLDEPPPVQHSQWKVTKMRDRLQQIKNARNESSYDSDTSIAPSAAKAARTESEREPRKLEFSLFDSDPEEKYYDDDETNDSDDGNTLDDKQRYGTWVKSESTKSTNEV